MDTITIDKAGEIDMKWINGGHPADGLRMVDMRTAGNGYRTYLEVPGDDSAPYYMRQNGHFVHIAGPTLAEWQAQLDAAELEVDDAKFYDDNIAVWDAEERARQAAADAAELEGVLQAEYRDERETARDLRAGAVQ